MAAHSSILAWRIPWTEEPAGLQSTGSQRDTTEQLSTQSKRQKTQISPDHRGNHIVHFICLSNLFNTVTEIYILYTHTHIYIYVCACIGSYSTNCSASSFSFIWNMSVHVESPHVCYILIEIPEPAYIKSCLTNVLLTDIQVVSSVWFSQTEIQGSSWVWFFIHKYEQFSWRDTEGGISAGRICVFEIMLAVAKTIPQRGCPSLSPCQWGPCAFANTAYC